MKNPKTEVFVIASNVPLAKGGWNLHLSMNSCLRITTEHNYIVPRAEKACLLSCRQQTACRSHKNIKKVGLYRQSLQ